MHYRFGYSTDVAANEDNIVLTKNISKETYKKHKKTIKFCRHYSQLKSIYSFTLYNGKNFLTYMELASEFDNAKDVGREPIRLEGNRLLLNYLTSIETFIDYGQKIMRKTLGEKAECAFQNKTFEVYDKHIAYRFLIEIRTYTAKYRLPLQKHVKSLVSQSGLFASKGDLLEYKDWDSVRDDIEGMPELIKLDPYVNQMQQFMKELFDFCFFLFSSNLIEDVQSLYNLVDSIESDRPTLIRFKSEKKYRNGKFSTRTVDEHLVYHVLHELQNYPSITMASKNEEGKQTRLEFYFENELIMDGTVSYFQSLMTSPTDNQDDEPMLSLGDQFRLADFPEEGVSQLVRIVKISCVTNWITQQDDIIRYDIEPYEDEHMEP